MSFIFTNNAITTISAGITATDTTVNLASGSGALFPPPVAGQSFVGELGQSSTHELVLVTGRSGDALTVQRGYDNTSAAAFSSGSPRRGPRRHSRRLRTSCLPGQAASSSRLPQAGTWRSP